MRKLTILLALALATTAAVGGVMATDSGTCNYKADGTYLMSNGTAAFGTMNDAMHCASQGILPQVVADRLGRWGDQEAQEWAEDIKRLNQEVIERNKEAEEPPIVITPIIVEPLDAPEEGV
jgi:hypothetical protein|tara:strand:+ start:4965 stop:5327 length:363 start_codon:yes stop_codon:yes gene_type:complete